MMNPTLSAYEQSPVTWNPGIECTVDRIDPETSTISFYRNSSPVLQLEMKNGLAEFLFKRNEVPSIGESQPLGLDLQYSRLIKLLQSRNIVKSKMQLEATLNIFSSPDLIHRSFKIPSEEAFTINLLAGDEASLENNFKRFVDNRDDKRDLVGTIIISPNGLEISPVRFKDEMEYPKRKGNTPRIYPTWPNRLVQCENIIVSQIAVALSGPEWFGLTARGLRLPLKWEESRTRFMVEVQPVNVPKEAVQLYYSQAKVEDGLLSAGTGTTQQEAHFAATSEAWERYVLERPDLAIDAEESLPDLRFHAGVHYDYLRSLCTPLRNGPKSSSGRMVESNQRLKLPSEWIYFNGKYSPSNTNGAAFGSSLEDAIYAGKLEAIERHALMSAYFRLTAAVELTVNDLSKEFLVYAQGLIKRRESKFYCLGIWNKITTVLCVLSSNEPPYFSIGSATRGNLIEAARKALFEASAVELIWIKEIEKLGITGFIQKANSGLSRPRSEVGLIDSGRVWAGMKNGASLLNSILSNQRQQLSDESNQVWDFTDEILERDFAYVELGKGLVERGHVVKVIHPHALPLPSSFEHATKLAEICAIKLSLPVPMT